MSVRQYIVELRERLNSQDNRATAQPLYCVQEYERIYGMDPDYEVDDFVWHPVGGDCEQMYEPDELETILADDFDCPKDIAKDHASKMNGLVNDGLSVVIHGGYEFERIYYVERWKFVNAHLTLNAAEQYIEQFGYNHERPRVYVTSQRRCHEWNAVVEYLRNRKDDR
jgi:hypothetical protein